ncbi:uncharacterized protein TRIADDRAFT_59867 [Trichoplax adhaerens]|uniref:Uncharacterized protein n=1 Tax=Trichoplax adhaerens TaxID=10228 RepID=B3S6N4_TRIAD|nr:predicted protein [Trichoplax adhaerens]EDV21787.1 predicted protein [Trichoplax adhaerens]|eukprot:XP_002115935.1 predicted protein [Trichoplax adhaerens]
MAKVNQGAIYRQSYPVVNAAQRNNNPVQQQAIRNISSAPRLNNQPGITQAQSQVPVFKYPAGNVSQQNMCGTSGGHLGSQRSPSSAVSIVPVYKQNSLSTDASNNNVFGAGNEVSMLNNRENSAPPLTQTQMYEQTFPNSNTSQQSRSSNITNKISTQNVDFQQFQFGAE